jgi:hypothetical protein
VYQSSVAKSELTQPNGFHPIENRYQPKAQIAPVPDFGSKFGALVRQQTLPKPQQKLQQPTNQLQMYLSWLHGDEPVLVEEARKKLMRLVMSRDDLEADWDDEGKLINVTFLG